MKTCYFRNRKPPTSNNHARAISADMQHARNIRRSIFFDKANLRTTSLMMMTMRKLLSSPPDRPSVRPSVRRPVFSQISGSLVASPAATTAAMDKGCGGGEGTLSERVRERESLKERGNERRVECRARGGFSAQRSFFFIPENENDLSSGTLRRRTSATAA